jgi:uncharacterized protein (DUF1501 family)
MSQLNRTARREFLRKLGATLAGGTAAAWLPQMQLMAQSSRVVCPNPANYRALVCVYLAGGSDSWNMFVPTDTAGYASYLAARGGVYNAATNPAGVAIDQAALLPVTPVGGGSFGFHPSFTDFTVGTAPNTVNVPGLTSLFNQGRVATLPNIGTLIRPITKAEYNAQPALRPPQLFSHNDQEKLWNLGNTTLNDRFGWGGRLADMITQCNGRQDLPAAISIAGSTSYLIGQDVFPYGMSTSATGATGMSGYTNASPTSTDALRRSALSSMLTFNSSHLLQREYGTITKRSIDLYGDVSTAMQAPANQIALPRPAGNNLADQLWTVARMIRARATLQQNRQVFYVRIGGFDTHDAQMTANGQPLLYTRVNQALAWFYGALTEMGMQDNVTTFTMSEFGRTLNSNGNGTDHAWGAVQLVMGGAQVNGGRIYGTYPEASLNGPISFSRGQFIPSMSVDQLGSRLASWMGLEAADNAAIFPNLGNFNPATLATLLA